jgi:hypothetical protein
MFGTANWVPVYGCLVVGSGGKIVWSGTDGVSAVTNNDGSIQVTLPETAYDYFTFISNKSIK